MARIAGIDLPRNKVGPVGLSYIYGIGRFNAVTILNMANVDVNKKVSEWNDEDLTTIRRIITEGHKVEGELRSEVQTNIKRLMDIGATKALTPSYSNMVRVHCSRLLVAMFSP